MRRIILAAVLICVALFAGWSIFSPEPPPVGSEGNDIADFIAEEGLEGYSRVTAPRKFSFPADHGPHEDYRSEWWYFTGNLIGLDAREYGYQLTFFRFSLAPNATESTSAWRNNQIFMAHFAVSDVSSGTFHGFERYSRVALGLAGALPDRLHVWLEDWSATPLDDSEFPLHLLARAGAVAIDLKLEKGKPVVLQGDAGFSQKSRDAGNASYYYSFTRMPTRGTIEIDGEKFTVSGNSWLDREWSTSALSKNQAGWDWFALRFEDDRELMYYRLRDKDGRTGEFSAGALIEADGTLVPLDHESVIIESLSNWESPETGIIYPSDWRLRIPDQDLDLHIKPLIENQEMHHGFRYWEGAVSVGGTLAGKPASGRGYVELTGYGSR